MWHPTIILSPRLAPLLGLENPDSAALFMMWGKCKLCSAAYQHTSLNIMSTDEVRVVVGPAPNIVA
jgi:hypothetical protein